VVDVVPSEYRGTLVCLTARQSDRTHAQGRLLEPFIPQQVDEIDRKPGFAARSAAGFMTQYRRLPRELQRYGICLMLESDLDSPSDRQMVERLKKFCTKWRLFLFTRTMHDSCDWQQISGPSLDCDVHRPKSIPSWSVCTSWSPIQKQLMRTWAMPLWVSTGYENGVSNTTVSDEVVEITFSRDRRYMEGVRGEPTELTGRSCIEHEDLILQFDT
jgi:hypothetical protein